MKRVQLSTWMLCAETGVRLEKNTLCYQDEKTKKVYSLCTDTVKNWLFSGEDGSIIPNEEPVRDAVQA